MRRFSKVFLLKKLLLVGADIICANFAFFFTLLLSHIPFSVDCLCFIPISAVAVLAAVCFTGVHRITWKHAGYRDIVKMSSAVVSAMFVSLLLTSFVLGGITDFGVTEWLFSSLLAACSCVGVRMVLRRFALRRTESVKIAKDSFNYSKTLIIGAGCAAEILLREIFSNPAFSKCDPVALVDDNPDMRGALVRGVCVVGGRDSIVETVRKYGVKTIFFAIPSASTEDRKAILNICSTTGCDLRIMPGVSEALDNADIVPKIRKVQITDLLGRDTIKMEVNKILCYVEGKTVLVTGGGGSIGSELCRQIAGHNPKQLVIFDIYENNTYDILNELKRTYPSLDVVALIGSVRDKSRLEYVFDTYRPDIVYHAAAHKHVPLMETSPREAVKNNVFGTLNTVRAADKYHAKRFVMISTDKAVNPTNIMGATKRVCEMIVQTYNKKSETEFVAVRFGNVLGSNGSVIPLFEKQIESGGPVTVTHPDIIRYFMTIPEAVSLVLSAGATASGGEIFVLDMGEPVKILDLAENMIRLSGFEPYRDININFTGLRPGEKLYEELLMNEEGLEKTENSLIYIGKPIDIDEDMFFAQLDNLYKASLDSNADVRQALHDIVPTFKEADNNTEEG